MEHLGDNVISFLKEVSIKIEELQVQTALGKAELSDMLEEVKKEAKHNLQDLKSKVNSVVEEDKEEFVHLKAKIEHLDLQLALGKAETSEALKEQKKTIKAAVHDVQNILAKD